MGNSKYICYIRFEYVIHANVSHTNGNNEIKKKHLIVWLSNTSNSLYILNCCNCHPYSTTTNPRIVWVHDDSCMMILA